MRTFAEELEAGTQAEMEHTDDPREARSIALTHLRQDRHYYSKLFRCMPAERPKTNPSRVIGYGVFIWNKEGRYPETAALHVSTSEKRAQRWADLRNDREGFARNLVVRPVRSDDTQQNPKGPRRIQRLSTATLRQRYDAISPVSSERPLLGTELRRRGALQAAPLYTELLEDIAAARGVPFKPGEDPVFWAGELTAEQAATLLERYGLHGWRGIAAARELTPQEVLGEFIKTYPEAYRRNPAADLPLTPNGPSKRVEEAYIQFHGVEPGNVTDLGKVWVPGPMVLLGPCIDVGYNVLDKRSTKSGRYVHDHKAAVKVYRRAEAGEQATLHYKNFPRELWVLGSNIGFTFEDRGDGEFYEVPGSSALKICSNAAGDMLVLADKTGVRYLIKGGRMRVRDWIFD